MMTMVLTTKTRTAVTYKVHFIAGFLEPRSTRRYEKQIEILAKVKALTQKTCARKLQYCWLVASWWVRRARCLPRPHLTAMKSKIVAIRAFT